MESYEKQPTADKPLAASAVPPGRVFSVDELRRFQKGINGPYFEIVHIPSMCTGLYVLPAGATDLQTYHHEDEVYYVIRGKAQLTIDGHDYPVATGSVIFVSKAVHHKFHSIEEQLEVLVFFAPMEVPIDDRIEILHPQAVVDN